MSTNLWKKRLESARETSFYKEYEKNRVDAKKYYRGDQIDALDKAAWEGDQVEANLFHRMVNFISDAVYSKEPDLRISPEEKMHDDPRAFNYCQSVEGMLKYSFRKMGLNQEIKRAFKDSFFSNLAAIKIEYNKKRGLWAGKWVAGELICDPDAHGDIKRARWFAEKVEMPRYRIWQDQSFDPTVREDFKSRGGAGEGENYQQSVDYWKNRTDVETLYYIYTHEGEDPFEGNGSEGQNRLMVMCENYPEWLLNEENPCPWLPDDDFPYCILRLDETPGEFIGVAMWRIIGEVCRAFNWAASYHMTDMRKTASRPIGYDLNKIDDPNILKSRKHAELIPCDGPPKDSVTPLDIGQGDPIVFKSVEFWYDMLNRLTGVDDIARGEEGKTKTATESQILQQNSSISLRTQTGNLDLFLNDFVSKLALVNLYYMHQFSTFMQSGIAVTKIADPQTGMVSVAPSPLDKDVAKEAGLTEFEPGKWVDFEGKKKDGEYVVKGIDYFLGQTAAANWPTANFEEIKDSLNFSIEAGSSHADKQVAKQRNTTAMFNTFGPELKLMQMYSQYYELWIQVAQSFEVGDLDRIIPPKDQFIAAMQMAMQQQMMMGAAGGETPPMGEPVAQGDNGGKEFPLGAM